ncbi:MAG: glycosyltransferase family 9 protein [Crocinitomicaceae bacterium]|nr:glycosyltransferase family 9 protein [Crocinitomicaceae bacterium]MDG1775805.1 glycosyltransferase family 9 protein [Crocinitomicaceae bacterium]
MKILIIRFSAIGDVVLTSPILRCLKTQKKCTLHYVVKSGYSKVLEHNPHIDKLHVFNNSVKEVLSELKSENFDLVFDLQNNAKSWSIKSHLKTKTHTVDKKNWQKMLLIHFRRNVLKDHVVDRYFECIAKAGFYNDHKGLEYHIPSTVSVDYDVSKPFVVWSIGASFYKKKLSEKQILEVCNRLTCRVVLVGGPGEQELAASIVKKTVNPSLHNFCGDLSLDESAYLVQKSELVLTNDTGVMHIAAAFNKKIISFWGCTKPSIGFGPRVDPDRSITVLSNKSEFPCSKHGKHCRFQSDGCIKTISTDEIYDAIIEMGYS